MARIAEHLRQQVMHLSISPAGAESGYNEGNKPGGIVQDKQGLSYKGETQDAMAGKTEGRCTLLAA